MDSIYLQDLNATFQFKVNDYNEEDYVINCKTEYEAEALCKILDANGKVWDGNYSYIKDNRWHRYFEKMCYRINRGSYSSLDYYISKRDDGTAPFLNIYYFEDFLIYNNDKDEPYYIHSEGELLDLILIGEV